MLPSVECPTCGTPAEPKEAFRQATRTEPMTSLGWQAFCPSCSCAFKTEAPSLEAQLGHWTGLLDMKRAHQQRTLRYYDDAPDGSKQKQDAIATLARLSDDVMWLERQIDRVIDQMP